MSAGDLYRELQLAIRESEQPAPCEEQPLLFFADTEEQYENPERVNRVNASLAKLVCYTCPVKDMCAAYALEADEEYGVWGGLSPEDRRAIKRLRR